MKELNFVIIVPVYNAEDYLERAVDSIVSQEYERWQLLLVDDGSTDGSPTLCDHLSQKNDRVFAIHQDNMGQLSTRVNGICYARNHLDTDNTFFLFLDADDIFVQGALSRIDRIISESGCDLLIFGIKKQNPITGKVDLSMQGTYEGAVTSRADLYRIVLFDYQYNSLCRKAVSAALVPDRDYSDLYGLRHGEDLLQSYAYYQNCNQAFFSRDILYMYYLNNESVTNNQSPETFQYGSQVRSLIWDAVVADRVWTEVDLKKYSEYNCRLLRNKIMSLCMTEAPVREIIPILERMKADPFYQRIVSENSGYDRIIKLFAREKYQKMITYTRLRVKAIRMLGR